ncbi:MAG: ADP-ribosylglycohydrolase family protein [Deinococcales bacterium]
MKKDTLNQRARASLLALAIGDALGATNEFKTKEAVTIPVRNLVGGGWLGLQAGEVTDDTEMTLCILEAYAEGYSLDKVAHYFLAWYESKPKDIGNLTRAALGELKRGVSARDSGRIAWERMSHSGAGNGAIMRCAPTAWLRAHDREIRVLETIEIARITHFDRRAVEAALWQNAMIAALLCEAPDPWEAARQELLFARAEQEWATVRGEDVLDWVERGRSLEISALDTSGYALATAQVAAFVLEQSASLEEGLILAVNQGGDADTIGAVAGALLGAKYGLESIPERWLNALLWKNKLEQTLQTALEQNQS